LNRLILGHLNINSLRNKKDLLSEQIKGNVDILLLSETKLDKSFPETQFLIEGFTPPFRMDRNSYGGGIMLYVRNDIPAQLLKCHTFSGKFENFFVEINLRKKKWLVSCSYNPHLNEIASHLNYVSDQLDYFSAKYENFVILGDFNVDIVNKHMKDFCSDYNLKSLIKEPTCYKSRSNPTCIDLILTNRPRSFEQSCVIETGLSDFHRLTLTVLKTFFQKSEPRKIIYRNYRNFNNDLFKSELVKELSRINIQPGQFDLFKSTTLSLLDNYAPLRTKYVRYNQSPFMNKELSKAIMTRSRLLNKFQKTGLLNDRNAYNKQRNYSVSLLRKTKADYYNNLDTKQITDNRKFWKTVKPCFSDKASQTENIILIENDEIISDCEITAETFSAYFEIAAGSIGINENETDNGSGKIDESSDKIIEDIIFRYKRHPSILKIKDSITSKVDDTFSFKTVDKDTVLKLTNLLTSSKAAQDSDIPTRIIKENMDIFGNYLVNSLNFSIKNQYFPNQLKNADIKPVHKKGPRTDKTNYRPISILPNISKIYERYMHNQISEYFESFFSKFQFGFRKNHSAQQCLIAMIEKFKKSKDSGNAFGAVLTDLSKAFDCISYDLLIGKLDAYGFDRKSLKFILSYLTDRRQRVKIGNSFSGWKLLKRGIPQGSILGPLLFNIFISDLFLFVPNCDIANYADDNTPYSTGKTDDIILNLQTNIEIMLDWFTSNKMKANPQKSHLFLSDSKITNSLIGGENLTNNSTVKLLGVNIDNKLSFAEHVDSLCNKASQKVCALTRQTAVMNLEQRKRIMKAFILSQFSYCPLLWMFHSRKLNHRINRIHERCLRLIYKDYVSTFQELLVKDSSLTIHETNLHKLALEIFRVKNNLCPILLSKFLNSRI
jgi:exonuclease III